MDPIWSCVILPVAAIAYGDGARMLPPRDVAAAAIHPEPLASGITFGSQTKARCTIEERSKVIDSHALRSLCRRWHCCELAFADMSKSLRVEKKLRWNSKGGV